MRASPPSELFTLDAARAAGWTDSALCRAVKSGRLVRVRPAVYATREAESSLLATRAAALAYPDLPLSHLSAARLWGIPIVAACRRVPEVTVPPRSNANLPGMHPYRARVREHDTVLSGTTLLTSPARTVLDIARHRPLLTAVVAIDHVLHEGMASADELVDVFAFCHTWPGGPRARRALRLADSRSESPLESISRVVIPSLGLPAPEPQVEIFDESGRLVGRGDFYWDRFGVVGEADGRSKYDDRDVLMREKEREEALQETALELTRWGWRQAWSQRPVLRDRIERAFERGLARDRAGQRRRWTAVGTGRIVVPV